MVRDELFRAVESVRRNIPRRSQHRTPKQGREQAKAKASVPQKSVRRAEELKPWEAQESVTLLWKY